MENLSLAQLLQKRRTIELQCAMWKDCVDGSYEAILNAHGYYKVNEEIKRRTDERCTRTGN